MGAEQSRLLVGGGKRKFQDVRRRDAKRQRQEQRQEESHLFQVKQIHLYRRGALLTQTQLLDEARRRFSELGSYETSLLRDYPFLKTRASRTRSITEYHVESFKRIMFDVMREQIDFPEADKDLLVPRSETSTEKDYTVVQLYFEISWVLDAQVYYTKHKLLEDITMSTWSNQQVELEYTIDGSKVTVLSVPSPVWVGFGRPRGEKSLTMRMSDPEDGLLTREQFEFIVDDHIIPYLDDQFVMNHEQISYEISYFGLGLVWANQQNDDIVIRESEFSENPNVRNRYTFTMSDYLLTQRIQDENGNYPLDEYGIERGYPLDEDGNEVGDEVGIPQNEQEELDNDTIPQYTDQLTEGEEYTVVPLKTTWTLQQFQTLGKYYFEKELIYDNFLQDPEDVGCLSGIGYENVRLPVRTGQGGIYCVLVLEQWLGAGNTSDPLTNTKIETIHVMDEEEIREQEWRDIQNQRETLTNKGDNQAAMNLPSTLQEYGVEKRNRQDWREWRKIQNLRETLTAEINSLKKKQKKVKDNQAAIELRQKIANTEKKLRDLPSTLQRHAPQ